MIRIFQFFLCLFPCVFLSEGARADILDTKHNLTNETTSDRTATAEERRRLSREVCVFCHTPGASDEEAAGRSDQVRSWPQAQWQSSVEATFSFELFDDIGRMGVDGAGAQPVGSVSVACLSCHDAVQALGVSHSNSSDHPFAVPYRGLYRYPDATAHHRQRIVAAQGDRPALLGGYMGDESEFRPARSGIVNKRQVWWAAVGDSGQRTKSDLPLYPRQVAGPEGYEQVPFVECTSCHDPHSTREVFLRTSNEQSKLCMTCHIK